MTSLPAGAETRLQAPGPQGPLEGSLLPGQPMVLIIPGSGATDRDGNGPGYRPETYRLLAEGLAARGIGSLRIDKRGLHGSRAAVPDAEAVTMADYAADIAAWAGVLRARGADRLWLAGHSEGGLVALLAAGRLPDLCGLVLLATPGRRIGLVLREQLDRALPGPLRAEAEGLLARLEAGQGLPEAIPPALLPLFRPSLAGFLASLFALDPPALAAAVRPPLLVLQGLLDLQVTQADAAALAAARPDARLVLLPGVNHVLKAVGEDPADNLAAYADPDRPLAPGVVEAIADFVAPAP
ncbi:alpha/beta fold hydrolase [Falsiroseomonas tokyonensis]|uniref:Alpha/beta hydrolase n=1 Tax=Falsiroseomonas tokyonensis TaxID=430521 RepID=A0ABV7BYT8_9PROT|nr:alpha/beta fold hydrolase [Falsiroseomonas tokyonensis]MBU8539093.1 alpha/beta fold hydrolase [Falsiroseomonas tokyonensis]